MDNNPEYENGLSLVTGFDPEAWEKKIPGHCLVDRNKALLKLCTGKRILHLGAADYPFHKEAALDNNLLHQKIEQVAKEVVGIDQNAEAIYYLRVHHGINNIIYADTTNALDISDERLKQVFDVILCCDIIEHVENPGMLIKFCSEYMKDNTLLVITTINASSIKNALRALQGREAVHHEHVSYYSYSTLGQLLYRHKLIPLHVGFFSYGTKSRITGWVFNLLSRLRPGSADGILITCKKQ